MKKLVTWEEVENNPLYRNILSTGGHGVPSSDSRLASVAIATVVNWWSECLAGGAKLEDCLADIDTLCNTLTEFERAVREDPTLLRFSE